MFTQQHPPKRFPSPWFGKTAPRLQHLYNTANSNSPKLKHKHVERERQRLAKSTENLHIASNENSNVIVDASSRRGTSPKPIHRLQTTTVQNESPPTTTTSSFYLTTNFIELPKDYNPIALLQGLETMQAFFSRTFPKQRSAHNTQEKMATNDLLFEENSEEHSFTNHLFDDSTPMPNAQQHKGKNLLAPCANFMQRRTLQQLLTEKRERELHAMGCLMVELFIMQRLRPLLLNHGGSSTNFEQRLQACRIGFEMHKQDIPKCLRSIISVLLQLNVNQTITEKGLPIPNAAQILEPIFANTLIPFPNSYYSIYALIRSLQSFDYNTGLLELYTHFNCNGKECSKYSEMDRKRVLFERKIAECKVMSCCAHIEHLLEPVAYEQFSSVELLLPHIIDLLTDEKTSILTAWNLFDPVAQALGIANTQKYLLIPIMKLYDIESFERCGDMISVRSHMNSSATSGSQLRFSTSSSFKSRKSVKLYHQIFLLSLIVRFGLRCFLQNFIAPLIEAVGGYKEPEEGTGLHYHSLSSNESTRRTSKNLNYALDEAETSITLMSSDAIETELEDATLSLDVPGMFF